MARQLTKECGRCQGTGQFIIFEDSENVVKDECPECGGSGVLTATTLDLSDVLDKLNDISDKVNDIFEKVNE